MKSIVLKIVFIVFAINISSSQEWMTSLDIAQKLALVQNKMVLMVWEGSTKQPYPVLLNNYNGETTFINNLFDDENVSPLIWKHFIPVIVSEDQYADLYLPIEGKRKQSYINKFNDNSIKIMDVNGNILNATDFSENYDNISEIIKKYALSTEFIAHELSGYQKRKDFYSAYFLASKYLDFALYTDAKIRPAIIALSNIYLDEAKGFSAKSKEDNALVLQQRTELLKAQESLLIKRPKKVLRQLKKMKANAIENNNKAFVAFLYYTAYKINGDDENAELWKSKVSSVNLKKAKLIINLNS
jgi:hypothetical protein